MLHWLIVERGCVGWNLIVRSSVGWEEDFFMTKFSKWWWVAVMLLRSSKGMTMSERWAMMKQDVWRKKGAEVTPCPILRLRSANQDLLQRIYCLSMKPIDSHLILDIITLLTRSSWLLADVSPSNGKRTTLLGRKWTQLNVLSYSDMVIFNQSAMAKWKEVETLSHS